MFGSNTSPQTTGNYPTQTGKSTGQVLSGIGGAINNFGLGLTGQTSSGVLPSNSNLLKGFNPGAITNGGIFNALGTSGVNAPSLFKTTSAGGTSFPAAQASGVNTPAISSPNGGTNASNGGLGSLLTNTLSSPNGGQFTTDANGNVTGYTPPAGYSIDTSAPANSSSLSSGVTSNDVLNQQTTYQDYVNALSQAQQGSPGYYQSYGNLQQANVNQAGTAAALVTPNAPAIGTYLQNPLSYGDTMGYAQGLNAQEQNTAALQQSSAAAQFNVQQMARQNQISAIQSQLQYSPTGISGAQATTQYQQLQQQYPNAGIPPFNPQGDPIQQYNNAMQIVGNSAAYQAGFQSTYTTPGGGTGIYSKLNLSGLQQNSDGSYTLVPSVAAALGAANANIINQNLGSLAQMNTAIGSTQKILGTTQTFMQQNGLNSSSIGIINQIQQSVMSQTGKQDAVAAWNNDLTALREDYAQYITARGGSVAGTGVSDPQVLQEIPDNVSLAQLQNVVSQMTQVGQDTADSVNNILQGAIGGLQTNTTGATTSAAGGTSAPGSFASGTGWN